jgi:hypothetical protein
MGVTPELAGILEHSLEKGKGNEKVTVIAVTGFFGIIYAVVGEKSVKIRMNK